MRRYAAYVRVSTEEQRNHGLSVEAQTHSLQEWAKANKCKLVGTYIDAGFSARKKAHTRPELQRMLNDVRDGKIDVIVFTKLDRWFRNVQEYYKVQEVLDDNNVSWHAIHEDYETETASGRLKVNIMLAVAQDEADRDSERIKAVLARKKELGEVTSGSEPFGYKKQGTTLIHDPETEQAVNRFFELMIQTRSTSGTIRQIEQEYGIRITKWLADKMRRAETYIGNYHGVPVPPYITKEQHDLIVSNIGKAPSNNPTGRVYLFSGILQCKCGCRMFGHTIKAQRGNPSLNYQCRRYANRGSCNNKTTMSERKIERYLLDSVESELNRYTLETASLMQPTVQNYDKEIASVKKKLARLKTLYVEEMLDIDEYRTDYARLTAQLDDAETKKAAAERKKIREPIKLPDNWKETYSAMEPRYKSEFWASILESITIDDARQIHLEFK